MSSTGSFNDFYQGHIINNLNGGGSPLCDRSKPKTPLRLSPRVTLGVELNILKSHSGLGATKSQTGSSKLPTRRTKSHTGYVSDGVMSPTYQHGLRTPLRVTTEPACSRPVSSSGKGPISPALRGSGLDSDYSGTQTSSTESHASDSKLVNQLQAYMLWINSQLKKKPGARLVEDLRNDTRDGVAFIDLIHVISREEIPGVHAVPSTFAEMRENIERVLQFMSSKRIRMHHILAKDIVDGNLKSIMRLILALAAHYKPKSVKHSTQNSGGSSGSKSPNVTGIAQGASAALAQARRTVAKAGSSFRRKGRDYRHRRSYHQESSSDQYSDSDQSFHPDLSHSRFIHGRERGDVDGASAGSSPTASSMHSPQSSLASSCTSVTSIATPMINPPVCKSRSADPIFSKESTSTVLEDSVFTPGRDPATPQQWPPGRSHPSDDLLTDYIKLAQAMNVIKKELSSLQDLLLNGEPPDGEESRLTDLIEGTTPVEQIVILRSQLQQSKDVCSDLREELSRSKLDSMQMQGDKGGLQQRLSEQEATISQLKNDLLRMDFQKQNFDSDKSSLSKQIEDKEKLILNLRRDIGRREQRIEQLQHEVQMQVTEKENVTSALKLQLKDLNDRFRAVDETGATLKAHVESQDKKLAKLAGRILHTKTDQTRPAPTGADELSVLRDSLSSLRHNFSNSDPQQHTLDTLEQGITSLMERIPPHTGGSSSNNNNNQNLYDHRLSRKLNFDSTGDVRRSPITAIPGSKATSFNPSKLDGPSLVPTVQATTKVLYFTDNVTTPSMLTICKRLGEITLKDFKAVFDRPGHYRYHFKALDPEFGTVKEEISNEDAIIPGWEGKIVAWIEEDAG